MAFFQGKILREGRIVLDNLKGELNTSLTPAGVVIWGGQVHLPPGDGIAPGIYQLVLADGRSGDIIIASRPGSGYWSLTAPFTLSGPLW
jgi:hypothetical protein